MTRLIRAEILKLKRPGMLVMVALLSVGVVAGYYGVTAAMGNDQHFESKGQGNGIALLVPELDGRFHDIAEHAFIAWHRVLPPAALQPRRQSGRL